MKLGTSLVQVYNISLLSVAFLIVVDVVDVVVLRVGFIFAFRI